MDQKRLLPGEIPGEKHKYKCHLCEKTVGIFQQQNYGCKYCVCHGCMIAVVIKSCEEKDKQCS